jgi:hypothetical protein
MFQTQKQAIGGPPAFITDPRDAEWPLPTSLDDERRLFPGLGGLASELRGYYGLKRAADNGRQTSYSHPPN